MSAPEWREVYPREAFEGQVGKTIPVKRDGRVVGQAELVRSDAGGLSFSMVMGGGASAMAAGPIPAGGGGAGVNVAALPGLAPDDYTAEPLEVVAFGDPAPQGSKSANPVRWGPKCPKCQRRKLNFIGPACPVCQERVLPAIPLTESSKRVQPWRREVAAAAATAMAGRRPITGGVAARMVFSIDRPKSHYRTGRFAHLLRDDAPEWCEGYPDLSKLLRSTEDAMTGIVWADDSQAVEYRRLAAMWTGEDPEGEAPAKQGVVVKVWAIAANPRITHLRGRA